MTPKRPLQGAHDASIIFMGDVEHLAHLFTAIVALAQADKTVNGLAQVGAHIASQLANDIDLLIEDLQHAGAKH